MATPAMAQNLRFGVKGGVNLTEVHFKHKSLSDLGQDSKGFFIGPMLDFSTFLGVGVDAALLYSQRGKGDLKQQGFEIPVNLKYSIGMGNFLGIFFAAGPDFYFNMKDSDSPWITKEKKAQVGINLGGGVKMLNHLQVGINYMIPMNEGKWCNKSNSANSKYKYRGWQLSLAYLF